MTGDGSSRRDVEERIKLAQAAWAQLREFFSHARVVHHGTLVRMYDAIVVPILTYACATWTLTEAELRRLGAVHRRGLRYICGISLRDRLHRHEVCSSAGSRMMEEWIQEQRLLWALRTETSGVYGLKEMQHVRFPDGHRGVGRPRPSWERLVRDDMMALQYVEYSGPRLDFARLPVAGVSRDTIHERQSRLRSYRIYVPH